MKQSETRLASLKARIKEVQAEAASPFKAGRIDALQGLLRTATKEHKLLQTAQRDTAKSAQQAAQAIKTDLGGALSALSPRLAGLAGVAGPLTAVAAALVAIGVATAGIYKLVVASAEATGKLHDLSQQTGFSVETLSALSNAAETSGGSIESITSALFLFETKMGDAKDKTSETSKVFKALEIDSTNNEKALRQAITALLAMTNAEDQATIGKKLFGRSVKDLMGAIKQAGGLDAFLNRQLKDGTLITTEAAKRGAQFSTSLTILGQKFKAVGRLVADEFAPLVSDALSTFSRWLKDNQKELVSTAREVATLVKDISSLASFIYSISPIKLQIDIIRTIKQFSEDIFPSSRGTGPAAGKSLFDNFREFIDRGPAPAGSRGAMVPVDTTKIANQTKAQIATTAKGNIDAANQTAAAQKKIRDALANLMRGGAGGKGGGGGGDASKDAQRMAELTTKAIRDGLEAQETALVRSLRTRRISLEQYTSDAIALTIKQRDAEIKGLDAEEKTARALKKGSAVALADITLKRQEVERKSADNVAKFIDAQLDDFADHDRIREEGMLRVKEIVANTEMDLWQRLADQRVITQETAIKAIGNLEMEALGRQMSVARSELSRAGANVTQQKEALMKMGEIEAQIGALSIDIDRRAADAMKARTIAQREFNATLERTVGDLQMQSVELQKQKVLHVEDMLGRTTKGTRTAIGVLDIEQENLRNQLAKRELFLNLLKEMEGKSFDERTELYKQFIAVRESLDQQSAQTVLEVSDRPLIRLREQMRTLADDLTDIFAQSIGDGFEKGAKHGLATLAQGLLRIVEDIFLKMLAEGLGDLLGDFATGGGKGGGWLAKLFGIGVGAVAGGVGGLTGGFAGGAGGGGSVGSVFSGAKAFAQGGYLPPGQWGIAGEQGPEPIYGGRTGMTVVPNRATENRTTINNINVTVPMSRGASFKQQITKRQLAESIAGALQT